MSYTVLVTGGCGFIGANFVRFLLTERPDWRVVNIDKLTYAGNQANLVGLADNPAYTFVHGDICDQALVNELFDKHNVQAVVHFAAESHVDRSITGPDAFIRTNINGTFVLLETARAKWLGPGQMNSLCRFLHVSTDEVFGSLGPTGYFTEETSYDPRSPYSASKASSDHLVRAYFHTYGLPVLLTNCSNNYGPYQFPEKLIPLMISRALNDQSLPVYGKGENVRDWLHVYDHCVAIDLILRKGRVGEVYNIGGHNERTNLEVVQTILRELNKPESLIQYVSDRKGHDLRYAIDPTKIETELGWKPKYNFDTGIKQTIQWYLDNKAWWENILSGEYKNYFDHLYTDLKK